MRTAILTLMLIAGRGGIAFAQSPPPKLTPEQFEKIKQRDAMAREAGALEKAGKIKEAAAILEKAVIFQRGFLPEIEDDALYLIQWLAELQDQSGDYPVARKTWAHLSALKAKAFGKNHWQTVDARVALSNSEKMETLSADQLGQLQKAKKADAAIKVLSEKGQFGEAIVLAEEGALIRKEVLGEKHPMYASSLNNLAMVLQSQARFAKAEPLFLEALKIVKEVFGDKNPKHAAVLNNLAMVYDSQGRYSNAEMLSAHALQIAKETLGERDLKYAIYSGNLGKIHLNQGRYDRAEPLLLNASKIIKQALGEKHPMYATSLHNLAALYNSQGQFAKAEPLSLEAMRINREAGGENGPGHAADLMTLAVLQASQKHYAHAATLTSDAMRILKGSLGEKHPSYANCVNTLALLNKLQGRFAAAEQLYLEALKIRQAVLGVKHPDYAQSLNGLAWVKVAQNQQGKAVPMFLRAFLIIHNHLEFSAVFQSENDQLRYGAVSRSYLDDFLGQSDASGNELYAAVFRWHGSVTARQLLSRARAVSSPAVQDAFDELRDLSRQLNLLVQNPPKETAIELAKRIQNLEDRREKLQKQISSQSHGFARYETQLKSTPFDLQKSLPEGTAVVDFLVHRDSISAFIVTKTTIRRVVLQGGKGLDEELDTKLGFLSDLSLGRTRPVTGVDDVSAKLRARVWEPLEEHLKGISCVMLCPDGALCRLPFAALPGSDPKKYLLEELSIVIVPVPQLLPGLLAVEAKQFTGAPSLLAVGDVDFDGDPAAGEKPKPLPVALTRSGDGLSWTRLPNTKGEVEVVEALFGKLPQATVKKLLGKEATEAVVERELSRHRFVHLATHGFFDPPKMVRQFKDEQSAGGEKILLPAIPPGLSSGIVCAGANKPTFQASGVLTASQIAELDLSNVELAVLSACETSLGKLAEGEGVLGLQRAFQIAGARSTITTLWGVDDQATAELMKRMYANRLEKGLSSAEALREAQIWVLNNGDKVGVFDEPQRAGKRTPPKFWAAFTLAGDWR